MVPCRRRRGAVTAEIHVGVEDPFVPARKAHPALLLDDRAAPTAAALAERLERLGFPVDRSQQHTFPGYERLHTADAHGNRVEILFLRHGSRG